MKEKRPFIIQAVIGAVLIGGGLLLRVDYYSNMLWAIGGGLVLSAAVHMVRMAYWQAPRRRDLYERKKREAHIDSVDERKRYLRMRAGHAAYQIMAIALLLIGLVLALFRAEPWVIGMLFALFVFQWATGTAVYRILKKRM